MSASLSKSGAGASLTESTPADSGEQYETPESIEQTLTNPLGAGDVHTGETRVGDYGEPHTAGVSWAIGGRLAAQAIQLVGTLVLGRLVAPHEFGIYAAAGIFVSLGQIFTDLGIGPAVVQQQRLTTSFLNAAFWVNAASGVLLSLISVILAWPFAAWFGYHDLRWVIPLASLAFTVTLSTVGLALLERAFRFRAIALVEATAVAIGQVVSVAVAIAKPTVLALAIGPIVSISAASVLVFVATGWRPSRPWVSVTASDLRELRSFVSFLSFFNLVTFGARNGDDFFLGRYVTASSLGFYSRSYQLMLLPVAQVTQALGRVLRPTFARVRDSRAALQESYTRAMQLSTAIGFLSAAVMIAMAPFALPALLGAQWQPIVPLFEILALSVPCQSISTVHGALYTATGNVRLLLGTGAISSIALIFAFAFSAMHGTEVVAWIFVIHSVVFIPVVSWPILHRLTLSVRSQLRQVATSAIAAAALYAILRGAGSANLFGTGDVVAFVRQLLALLLISLPLASKRLRAKLKPILRMHEEHAR